jgi:hypothetical protein
VGERLGAVERKLLIAALEAVKGDRRAAAEVLGISLKTVYNRLKEYGLDRPRLPGGRARGSLIRTGSARTRRTNPKPGIASAGTFLSARSAILPGKRPRTSDTRSPAALARNLRHVVPNGCT